MTLRDRISSTMKSIISSGQSLSKEFEDLYARVEQTEASQTALAKKIAETRTSITRQTDTVKQAKTAWNDLRREKTSTAEQIEKAAATYSKGLAAGIFGGADAGATPDTSGAAFQHPMLKNSLSTEPQGYAVGLDYVPYDNFPALLHQGERVLTANEARAQDREGGRQIVVNISGEWHVRSDADVDAIAGALADKLLLAQMAG